MGAVMLGSGLGPGKADGRGCGPAATEAGLLPGASLGCYRGMFFLVTGASGVGKSTVRRLIEPEFADVVETAELATLGETPEWHLAWRHRMGQRIVWPALARHGERHHLPPSAAPVPPGEV